MSRARATSGTGCTGAFDPDTVQRLRKALARIKKAKKRVADVRTTVTLRPRTPAPPLPHPCPAHARARVSHTALLVDMATIR